LNEVLRENTWVMYTSFSSLKCYVNRKKNNRTDLTYQSSIPYYYVFRPSTATIIR